VCIKEMRRTRPSVILYIFQVVAALRPEIGGEQLSPPGGRIAFAMLLSSLLSNVWLSNIIGDFVNRRECLRAMYFSRVHSKIPKRVCREGSTISDSESHIDVGGTRGFSVSMLTEPVPLLARRTALAPAQVTRQGQSMTRHMKPALKQNTNNFS
jgi:hypothetical protein